jgi:hypothetical protein
MTPVVEGTNLVVVGNWNPAILQSEWIVREVIGGDPAGTQVQFEFSPIAGIPPRTTIGNVTFVPTNSRLQMHPKSAVDEDLGLVETYTRKILALLLHTPVKAIGENFLFRSVEPPQAVLNEFPVLQDLTEKLDFDFTVEDREIGLAVRLTDGRRLNMERWLKSNGAVEFRFNFHYDVSSATQANEVLEHSFVENFKLAKAIVEAYGFTIQQGVPANA